MSYLSLESINITMKYIYITLIYIYICIVDRPMSDLMTDDIRALTAIQRNMR